MRGRTGRPIRGCDASWALVPCQATFALFQEVTSKREGRQAQRPAHLNPIVIPAESGVLLGSPAVDPRLSCSSHDGHRDSLWLPPFRSDAASVPHRAEGVPLTCHRLIASDCIVDQLTAVSRAGCRPAGNSGSLGANGQALHRDRWVSHAPFDGARPAAGTRDGHSGRRRFTGRAAGGRGRGRRHRRGRPAGPGSATSRPGEPGPRRGGGHGG
jgi:hypothetical protein